jgi:hypothetical protein
MLLAIDPLDFSEKLNVIMNSRELLETGQQQGHLPCFSASEAWGWGEFTHPFHWHSLQEMETKSLVVFQIYLSLKKIYNGEVSKILPQKCRWPIRLHLILFHISSQHCFKDKRGY